MADGYDAADNGKRSYDEAILAMRAKHIKAKKVVHIGDHELILGDCLKVMSELGRVDHIFTDPPYEAIMHAAKSGAARRIRTDGRCPLSALNFESIDAIREQVVELCAERADGWAGFFCAPEGVGRWADAINNSSAKYKRACVWIKPDSTPQLNGQGPAMGAENFIVAWCGSGFARWNAGGKRGVYTHLCNPPTRHGKHPTEKPVSLMREILVDFTCQGQTILDPFMGSGTTGVAAVQLGRCFTGIELDPDYFEIAVKRVTEAYNQPSLFPAEKPKPPKNGDMFAEVSA